MNELFGSEYPKINKSSHKRLRLNKAVAGSFEKRLKIISEAIEELNLDIQERERKSLHVQDKIDPTLSLSLRT